MAEQNNTNFISKIKIPAAISGAKDDIVYDILDASAIHELADLGLSTVLDFKGVADVKTGATGDKTELPTTKNEIGDVWHVKEEDYEYVWIDSNGDGIGDTWEEFGAAHDFVGTYDFEGHTHEFTPGSITIPDLEVAVSVPAYIADKTYLSAEADAPTLTGSNPVSVLKGDAATSIIAVTEVEVSSDTPQDAGSQAEWGATVDNGVLTFSWTANTLPTVASTVVTAITATSSSIDVSFNATEATDINTVWTASAPGVTISNNDTSGNVQVATGISINGTNDISDGVATGQTVDITTGTVGSVKLPTPTT